MKRVLSLILVISLVLNGFGFVFANEVPENLTRVVSKGYFGQGGLRLEDFATRAEFAVIALRLQGFPDEEVKEANIVPEFEDVAQGDWYAPFIGYAVAEGLFEGDSNANTFRPKDTMNYTEMMVVLMRALGYTEDLKDPSLTWPTDHLKLATEIGLDVDSNISPLAKVTRKMVAYGMEMALDIPVKDSEILLVDALEQKAKDLHISEAGHYVGENGQEVAGNVYIKSGDVTLENYVINGDLIISEEVGEGEVYLKNVTVMGETYINGGGENSIYLFNTILRKVTINKPASPVRLVTSDGTKIEDIIVETAAKLENGSEDSEIAKVTLSETLVKDAIVEVKGSFKIVEVKGSDIKVNLTKAVVDEMTVHENATGSIVDVSEDSTVANAVIDVEIKFTGQGVLQNVKVSVEGVTFEKSPINQESTVETDVVYYPPTTGRSDSDVPVDSGATDGGTTDDGTVDTGTVDDGLDDLGRPILSGMNVIFSPAILIQFKHEPATIPTAADFIITRSLNGVKDETFDGTKVFAEQNWITDANTLQITRTLEGIERITEHYDYHVEVVNTSLEPLIENISYDSNVVIDATYVKAPESVTLLDLDLYRTINGVIDTKFSELNPYSGEPEWRLFSEYFGGRVNFFFISEITPKSYDQEVIYYLGYKGQNKEEYIATNPYTVYKIQNLLLDVKDEKIVVGAEVDSLVQVNIEDAQVTLEAKIPDIVSIDPTTRKITGLKSGVVEIVATASIEGYEDVVKSFFITVINEDELEIIEQRNILNTKLEFVHQQVGYYYLRPSDLEVSRTINGVVDDSFQWNITTSSYFLDGEITKLYVNLPYVEGAEYTANLKPEAVETGFVLSEFNVINENNLEVYLSAVPALSTTRNFSPVRYINNVQDPFFLLRSTSVSFQSNSKEITFWNLPYEKGVSYKVYLDNFVVDRLEIETTVATTTGSAITVTADPNITVKVGDTISINPKVYNSENAIMENPVFNIYVNGEGAESVVNHKNGTFTFTGTADVVISISTTNGKVNGGIGLHIIVEP